MWKYMVYSPNSENFIMSSESWRQVRWWAKPSDNLRRGTGAPVSARHTNEEFQAETAQVLRVNIHTSTFLKSIFIHLIPKLKWFSRVLNCGTFKKVYVSLCTWGLLCTLKIFLFWMKSQEEAVNHKDDSNQALYGLVVETPLFWRRHGLPLPPKRPLEAALETQLTRLHGNGLPPLSPWWGPRSSGYTARTFVPLR